MEVYRYSYLIMVSFLMVIWGLLFWRRKDLREEMLFISLPLGFLGLLLEVPFNVDWWQPETITGTIPGIESFLFSVGVGGIAAVIYEELFYKHVRIRRLGKRAIDSRHNHWWLMVSLSLAGFYLLHGAVGLNTFVTTVIILVLGTLALTLIRHDLLVDALVSGLLLTMIIALVYTLTEWTTPGWVDRFWLFQNVPHIIVLNVPIDDIIFYFLFGAAVGPAYEFLYQGKLVRVPA